MTLTYYITARRQLDPLPGTDDLESALAEKVRAAFAAGVDCVQVREKDLPARRLARLLEQLRVMPEKKSSWLLVNERLDLALGCQADGVHLPSDSLPLSEVRARGGARREEGFVVGISCHNEEDVAQAAAGGADYVLLGPVFETPSKPGVPPLGLTTFGRICGRFPIRVLALGGVTKENAESCIRAGAAGVAGIRLFQQAPDLEQLCDDLRSL